MRVQSSTIYIRHTRLRILCYAYRSHVLYFPCFWPGSTHFPPALFALRPATQTDNTYTCVHCTKKKKKRRKIGFESEGNNSRYRYTRDETTSNVTRKCRRRFVCVHQQWRLLLFLRARESRERYTLNGSQLNRPAVCRCSSNTCALDIKRSRYIFVFLSLFSRPCTRTHESRGGGGKAWNGYRLGDMLIQEKTRAVKLLRRDFRRTTVENVCLAFCWLNINAFKFRP